MKQRTGRQGRQERQATAVGPAEGWGRPETCHRRGRMRQPTVDSTREPKGLGSARALADVMDRSFRIPGTSLRFGLDPLMGLFPVGGDVVGALVSGYILYIAWRNGAPGTLIGRMLVNVLVDTAVGAVPVLGDLFDAGWQANARNVGLLERWLGREGPGRHGSPAIMVAVVVALVVMLAAVVLGVWALYRVLI